MRPEYLAYAIRAQEPVLLSTVSRGATVHRLETPKLAQLLIPVPPLAEQERIVRILDEALADIATARANTQACLADSRELYRTQLRAFFDQSQPVPDTQGSEPRSVLPRTEAVGNRSPGGKVTRTGGRSATLRHIPGKLSLAVGPPTRSSRPGWAWMPLDSIARLESGHTPSRRHPEYWDGGQVPWIGIQDAREAHGTWIAETAQHPTQLGIDNSSARILPAGTVCLSRTASVGYVVIMATPMATSQDFVNWVCSDRLDPEFLMYLLLAEGKDLLSFSSGAVHQTIYFPEVKAFHVCVPDVATQRLMVGRIGALRDATSDVEASYAAKLDALEGLRVSLLARAFAGEL